MVLEEKQTWKKSKRPVYRMFSEKGWLLKMFLQSQNLSLVLCMDVQGLGLTFGNNGSPDDPSRTPPYLRRL